MAKDNVEKFEQLLISDETLQAKLRAATDAYTGDKKDEKAVFDALIRPLAEEAGLPFTYEEGRDYAIENRELSLDEVDGVSGGESYCFIIGGGGDKDVSDCDCMNDDPDSGGGACYYVGVGFFSFD